MMFFLEWVTVPAVPGRQLIVLEKTSSTQDLDPQIITVRSKGRYGDRPYEKQIFIKNFSGFADEFMEVLMDTLIRQCSPEQIETRYFRFLSGHNSRHILQAAPLSDCIRELRLREAAIFVAIQRDS